MPASIAESGPSASASAAQEPFLVLLKQVKPEVDTRLAELFAEQLKTAGQLGPEVKEILQACRDLSLRGGKRLRAALVRAGQVAFAKPGSSSKKRAVDQGMEVGVAVELLQTYFLIHDDWMDQDAERRGGPSVHAALHGKFSTPHIANSEAILAGDYLVALATRRLVNKAKAHAALAPILDCFQRLQMSAVLGQQLDISGRCKNAELIYKLKTSSYSVSGPLELGALLAGATPKKAAALSNFGDPVGVAFQLRDDLLGVFADPKLTGKPFGSDVRAGKWTWLLQNALENSSRSERTAIHEALGKPKVSQRKLRAAVDALRSSGAEAATERRIDEHAKTASKALKRLRLNPDGQALLRSAARLLTHREM